MPKRPTRRKTSRPPLTTNERIQREEQSALRRSRNAERRIAKLARQLSTAIQQREFALVELLHELKRHLDRPARVGELEQTPV